VDLCTDAGVYLVFSDCGLNVIDEDDYSTYATNEYYLGHVAHDEYADSYACAQDMIANGAKNFVIFGLPPGISANFDMRAVGAMDAITEAGLKYVEARSYAMSEIANNLMSQ
jgi:DNA-binding LacI/PurR family transcriptional regulator